MLALLLKPSVTEDDLLHAAGHAAAWHGSAPDMATGGGEVVGVPVHMPMFELFRYASGDDCKWLLLVWTYGW